MVIYYPSPTLSLMKNILAYGRNAVTAIQPHAAYRWRYRAYSQVFYLCALDGERVLIR